MHRRDFIAGAGLLGTCAPLLSFAQEHMPRRAIPGTDDSLPIMGLGNARVFSEGDEQSTSELLGILIDRGGAYVDCSGPSINTVGTVANREGLSDQLFLGTYIQRAEDAGDRSAARAFIDVQGKPQLDLVVTRNVDDYMRRVDSFRALKEEGLTRFVGVARASKDYHEPMMQLMQAGAVDFIQVNYSMLEPEAEERLLPMAQDLGVAILTNRPFINGRYFSLVSDQPLPEWASDFDCDTWAKFSLKYILSHPAVNCTLTETSNPRHALDNLGAGLGRLPDEATRKRMRETLLSMV